MYPILFEFFGFPISTFGVMMAVGFLVSAWIVGRRLGEYGLDPEFDLEANRVYAGMPALATGLYDLRVLVGGVESNVLEGVLDYRKFAEEVKVERARSGFSPVWKTGPRLLTGGGSPL